MLVPLHNFFISRGGERKKKLETHFMTGLPQTSNNLAFALESMMFFLVLSFLDYLTLRWFSVPIVFVYSHILMVVESNIFHRNIC